jgi:HAE1 family hydrophobic/amphiphilic exporter-1
MSKFFINRPIVAMVISIVMVIVGAITILNLPVAQFPNIAPPEIQVLATYVGADAQTLEQAVATPIEQQMNGVDKMNYMYSLNATGNSNTTLIVNFDVNTDPNTDLILAQSRETQAASRLPADVNNYGITVRKSVTAPLMWIALYSSHGTYDANFLANYAYINLNDPILRSPGIGQVQVFGSGQYAMRLWVKPDQLAKLRITVPEIISAIQAQNTVNPAGKVGGNLHRRVWSLPARCLRRAGLLHRRNSDESCCARHRTAASCGSGTSPGWSSAPRTIALPGVLMGSRVLSLRHTNCQARTRLRQPPVSRS